MQKAVKLKMVLCHSCNRLFVPSIIQWHWSVATFISLGQLLFRVNAYTILEFRFLIFEEKFKFSIYTYISLLNMAVVIT